MLVLPGTSRLLLQQIFPPTVPHLPLHGAPWAAWEVSKWLPSSNKMNRIHCISDKLRRLDWHIRHSHKTKIFHHQFMVVCGIQINDVATTTNQLVHFSMQKIYVTVTKETSNKILVKKCKELYWEEVYKIDLWPRQICLCAVCTTKYVWEYKQKFNTQWRFTTCCQAPLVLSSQYFFCDSRRSVKLCLRIFFSFVFYSWILISAYFLQFTASFPVVRIKKKIPKI